MITKNNSSENNAKCFFLYLSTLTSIIFLFIGTIMILFYWINKIEEKSSYYSIFQFNPLFKIRYGIAILLVFTPILYISLKGINNALKDKQFSTKNKLRYWFIYIILATTISILSIDFIIFITNFLEGELTTTFILKALVVLSLSSATITYFLQDLSRYNYSITPIMHLIRIIILISLSATCISGIIEHPSPFKMRATKLDKKRIQKIENIMNEIKQFHSKNKKLPSTLQELIEKNNLIKASVQDPYSKKIFEYKILGKRQYKICATFYYDKPKKQEKYYYNYFTNSEKIYKKGHNCFHGKV